MKTPTGGAAAAALLATLFVTQSASSQRVSTGADILVRDGFAALKGRKVGLITNHTGLLRDGSSIVDAFVASGAFELRALFSPEHGFDGVLDQAKVDDATHGGTGLKIHSLYGKTRKPTPEMLAGLDTLVFDIQDIGCRFYTYISTMKNAMEAAAEQKLRFVVLDRPNPIGGVRVAGPVLDDGKQSFVGCHTIPVQHGMTVGELAGMLNAEQKIGAELRVLRCEGWNRMDLYDATGLRWVNPSPNMRNLNQALLYPGVGLVEFTNVSVGRGTDTPFEILGAPWLDGLVFAQALRAQRLGGVSFVPVDFVPRASKFKGERCSGVQILITDRGKLDALHLGMALAATLRAQHKDEWQIDRYAKLLGDDKVLNGVRDGLEAAELKALWRDELRAFYTRRAGFLLYE